MRKSKGIDKRKAERINSSIKVDYRSPGSGRSWKKASCKDVSGIGIGLSLKEPVKINDKITISMCPSKKTGPVKAICKVIWCVQAGKGSYKSGLEVIEVDDPARFIEFICDKMLSLSL